MIQVKATIKNRVVLGSEGTTKYKNKAVRTLEFKLQKAKGNKGIKAELGDGLIGKMNGEQWDTCFDLVELLCELGLKIEIPQ